MCCFNFLVVSLASSPSESIASVGGSQQEEVGSDISLDGEIIKFDASVGM